tara:strand:+ start:2662 stop:3333 length:672 start_codon:yes stop_codon:yes gene_type:complete
MSKFSRKLLYLDTETTGSWLFGKAFSHTDYADDYYCWDDMLQLAVVGCNVEYTQLFKPLDVYFQNALEWYSNNGVLNIAPKAVRNQPTFKQKMDEVLQLLSGSVLVAHNASFDAKVLYDCFMSATNQSLKTLSSDSQAEFWKKHNISWLCTKELASVTLKGNDERGHYETCGDKCNGYRLTHLHHQLGHGDFDEHDALADVHAMIRVHNSLLNPAEVAEVLVR